MKVSIDELKNAESLRIIIDPDAASTAVAIADAFNAELDIFLEGVQEFSEQEDIDLLQADYDQILEQIAERRSEAFGLLQGFARLHNVRIEKHALILKEIQLSTKEALAHFEQVAADLKKELSRFHSDKADLARAVENTDDWKRAREEERARHARFAAMNNAPNLPFEEVKQGFARAMERLKGYVDTIGT